MPTPEGKIKRKVSALLKETGGAVWYFMPVKHPLYGNKSLDYICCVNGRFVAIETKKDEKSKLTKLQQITKKTIEDAGGTVLVVYDDDTLNHARDWLLYLTSNNRRLPYDYPYLRA